MGVKPTAAKKANYDEVSRAEQALEDMHSPEGIPSPSVPLAPCSKSQATEWYWQIDK